MPYLSIIQTFDLYQNSSAHVQRLICQVLTSSEIGEFLDHAVQMDSKELVDNSKKLDSDQARSPIAVKSDENNSILFNKALKADALRPQHVFYFFKRFKFIGNQITCINALKPDEIAEFLTYSVNTPLTPLRWIIRNSSTEVVTAFFQKIQNTNNITLFENIINLPQHSCILSDLTKFHGRGYDECLSLYDQFIGLLPHKNTRDKVFLDHKALYHVVFAASQKICEKIIVNMSVETARKAFNNLVKEKEEILSAVLEYENGRNIRSLIIKVGIQTVSEIMKLGLNKRKCGNNYLGILLDKYKPDDKPYLKHVRHSLFIPI